MPLVKKNAYGTISLSEKVMVTGILSAIENSGLSEDVWLATKRGRLLAEDKYFSNAEMRNSISAEFDERERIRLSFCVIVRFGVPIGKTVETLCDSLAKLIEERIGRLPSSIKVTVTGTRSSKTDKTVRRNMELEIPYGSET